MERLGRVLPVLLLVLAGCASAPHTAPSVRSGTISHHRFPALVAAPGETITIVNADSEPHTVTADDGRFGTAVFNSSAPGVLVAPMTPGTYPIHCMVHPDMHGTITVR